MLKLQKLFKQHPDYLKSSELLQVPSENSGIRADLRPSVLIVGEMIWLVLCAHLWHSVLKAAELSGGFCV